MGEYDIVLLPPRSGTKPRIVNIPPKSADHEDGIARALPDAFARARAAEALLGGESASRHPTMHRTETIDYGIVLAGEITLIMDSGDVVARCGDVIVQRGTSHGWSNRSAATCRMAFVLVDGEFDSGLHRVVGGPASPGRGRP